VSNDVGKKLNLVKEILKAIHRGEDVNELKRRFTDVLSQISPFEIPLIEQELIKEGVSIDEILKLCDLHVALFRDYLQSREIKDLPKGHPLDLLIRENEYILKQAEVLTLYASALLKAQSSEEVRNYLNIVSTVLQELRKIRTHYRKIQMLIFPYLERRGIIAVPRVLWGREDQVILKLRELSSLLGKALQTLDGVTVKELASKALELSKDVSELVFRENKILFPAVWVLFSEGEWATVAELGDDIGWLVSVESRWVPKERPIMPYELNTSVSQEQLSKLPKEFADVVSKGIQPDNYQVRREGDLDLGTGFLSIDEVKAIFKSLPIEITYANTDGRVKFYSESFLHRGFVRTKTIVGRRFEYCHPPRLEAMVKNIAKEVIDGKVEFREFWTRIGDRIIRVLITPVKDGDGKVLGVTEVVEDLTDVVNNVDEVKKKIMVL